MKYYLQDKNDHATILMFYNKRGGAILGWIGKNIGYGVAISNNSFAHCLISLKMARHFYYSKNRINHILNEKIYPNIEFEIKIYEEKN